MKIRDISVTLVEIPLTKAFVGSTYRIETRATVIVRVETDEGVTGEIYCGDERTYFRRMRDLILGPFRDVLIGEDLFAVERIWGKLFAMTPVLGDKKVAMEAISAVDVALWDAIGKALDTPVYKLLGGSKTEIPVIGIGYFEDGLDPVGVGYAMLEQKEMGYTGTKLKAGYGPVSEDVARAVATREVTGDDFILAVDPNLAWTVEEAVEFGRGVSDIGLAWLEEPVRWHRQFEGMARVRQATSVPVAAGQSELSGFGCFEMMRAGAVDFLNVDVSIAGGITEWRRIAAAAQYFGVRMIHHEEPHIALHLLCAVPHSYCGEVFQDPVREPVWHYMYPGHPEVRDGKMGPLDEPGLGLHIDEEFVRRYEVT